MLRLLLCVSLMAGCSKGDSKDKPTEGTSDKADKPGEPAEMPAKAEPVAATPQPDKPAGHPPPTEAEIRKALLSAGKTHSPEFSCGGGASYGLQETAIKKAEVIKTTVDGDFAVVEVQVHIETPYGEKTMNIDGVVKERFKWEAEWVLDTRDSTGVQCKV